MVPDKQLIFYNKVCSMRYYQERWHKYHIGKELEYAKKYQREVDKMIAEEHKEINSKQITLIK